MFSQSKRNQEDLQNLVESLTIDPHTHLITDRMLPAATGSEAGLSHTERILKRLYRSSAVAFDPDNVTQYLQFWIYDTYYCRNFGSRRTTFATGFNQLTFDDFGITTTTPIQNFHVDPFWKYLTNPRNVRHQAGFFTAIKGSEARFVRPEEFVESGFSEQEQKHFLTLFHPSNSFGKSRYKWLYGRWSVDDAYPGGVRFYISLDLPSEADALDDGFMVLLRKIQETFDRQQVPFSAKFQASAADMLRADGIILYIERRHFRVAARLLLDIAASTSHVQYRDDLPLFVFRLGTGIGFAETPPGVLSFGMNRSKLLAEAIVDAKGADHPVDKAIAYLKNQHLTLDTLHLNPGSSPDFYAVDFVPSAFGMYAGWGTGLKDERASEDRKRTPNNFVSAALVIARAICREVIWLNNGQCNWLSYQKPENEQVVYRLLDGSRGEGLEGVYLFLNQLTALYPCQNVELVLDGLKLNAPSVEETLTKDEFDLLTERVRRLLKDNQSPVAGLAEELIRRYVDPDRPIPNDYDGSDYFCPNLKFGLAGIGLFLLNAAGKNSGG